MELATLFAKNLLQIHKTTSYYYDFIADPATIEAKRLAHFLMEGTVPAQLLTTRRYLVPNVRLMSSHYRKFTALDRG